MTIEEYKTKVDEYLGLTGQLCLLEDDKYSTVYSISYCAPSGVVVVIYRIVRSKLHPGLCGWYSSGSKSTLLPDFNPTIDPTDPSFDPSKTYQEKS